MEIETRRHLIWTERTPGDIYVDNHFALYCLEDTVREIPGRPVSEWKVPGDTAIPRGRYRVTLETSGRFGPETITLHDVEGFTYIRAHGGNDITDTRGCILLGCALTPDGGRIAPGMSAPGVAILKRTIKEALAAGQEVWWTIT